jgi:hypothetical protein
MVELGTRFLDDRYFIEMCVDIPDLTATGITPFRFYEYQDHYYENIWCDETIRRDIVGKSRKQGFTALRVALGSRKAQRTKGHIFRVVSQRAQTSEIVNRIIKSMFESSKRNIAANGFDPDYFLPTLKYDNKREYYFPQLDSAVIVDTARGKGVGQSVRSDDLYITEYQEWEDATEKKAELIGSMPPHGTCTIDFNAKGKGNDAYIQYQRAKANQNGYVPVFYGINDAHECYVKEDLEQKRIDLQDLFPQVYPSNDVEMFLASTNAVFNADDLSACFHPGRYLINEPKWRSIVHSFYHGVDCSEGYEDSDYQARVIWALTKQGIFWEFSPCLQVKKDEGLFAEDIWRDWSECGGTLTIEKAYGQAVILRVKQLGIPSRAHRLFRHTDPNNPTKRKIGFPTTRGSLLRNKEVVIASQALFNELDVYEWKQDGTHLAGAPDMADSYDDLAMAAMIGIQGQKRAPKPGRAGKRAYT